MSVEEEIVLNELVEATQLLLEKNLNITDSDEKTEINANDENKVEESKTSVNVAKFKSSKISKIKSSKIMDIVRKEMTKDKDSLAISKDQSPVDDKPDSTEEEIEEPVESPINLERDCTVLLKRLSPLEVDSYNKPPKREVGRPRKSKGAGGQSQTLKKLKDNDTFLDNWNPTKSTRKTRKNAATGESSKQPETLSRNEKERKYKGKPLHDKHGKNLAIDLDLCDCLLEACPGCHFECPDCKSRKCGFECRNHRSWIVKSISKQGTDFKRFHPQYDKK